MNLDKKKDQIRRWVHMRRQEKVQFVKKGYDTWEFGLFVITLLAVLLSPFIVPGIYAAEDTTPDPEPYETVIPFDQEFQTTYVTIDCQPSDFIATERVAYQCDFGFEESDGSLQTYKEEYVRDARGENLFLINWTRRSDSQTEVRNVAIRVFADEFMHQSNGGNYTIHGNFEVVAPRTPTIHSFSIRMGEFFGGEMGDAQRVTVFSTSEASTLQTREFLRPFQQLIVVGILLSLLKFWVTLFNRIDAKISD